MLFCRRTFVLLQFFILYIRFAYLAVDTHHNYNNHEKVRQPINHKEITKEAHSKYESESPSKQYSELLRIKRREQLNSIQSLSKQKDYKKQKDTVKQLVNAIRKVFMEDMQILSTIKIDNIDEVLSDKSTIRDKFSRVLENIAFFGDITLRFPLQSGIKYNKDIEFKNAVNWAYTFAKNFSHLYDDGTLKMFHLFAQELKIIPREADYHNPYDITNIKENLIREASLKMEEELEQKRKAKKDATLKIKKDKSHYGEL